MTQTVLERARSEELRGRVVLVTGGGVVGNLPRVLPEGCGAALVEGSWPVPPVFRAIQQAGAVDEAERLSARDGEADAVDRFHLRNDAREHAALDGKVLLQIADDQQRLAGRLLELQPQLARPPRRWARPKPMTPRTWPRPIRSRRRSRSRSRPSQHASPTSSFREL